MDYLKIANSLPMWIAAMLAVSLVVIQAALFVRKSVSTGKEMGITSEQMKSAAKSSAFSSIGPSIAILVGMISLIVPMGGPISWMRLSFIGSAATELMGAGMGANAMNATLGGEGMNAEVFTNCVWVMTLGASGWLLMSALATHKMDKFRNVLAGGKKALVPIISTSAMIGAFAYMNAESILKWNNETTAGIAGFLTMIILIFLGRRVKAQWLKEWGLTIAIFTGIIVGSVI
jgi:hypothetical protein